MTIIDKIERQINSLAIYEVVPFSYIKLKDVSKDTIRKYLHRLHDRGLISIEKRGYFKKIKPFNEFLFVYGSLKKGFDNHKLLEKYAKRVGKASTVGKFAMYEDSFGNYPYLVKEPITKVMGELYEIKRKELLDKIDEFEGAPEYYQRKKIKVKTHKGVKLAFVYIREDEEIPKEQESLKIWENNTDYKVHRLDSFLEGLH
ncbi:gamma-glutamylcyclotransferase [Sulfurimonas sp. NW15]|uniref:gamma-glutamylcyclotransferase family protein n=1 Tax=Sulfurimonas sp. NW15 TaxID=2922729 RepID=UPI003DA7FF55